MPESSTGVKHPTSPIDKARAGITRARQLAGNEDHDPLTWDDRRALVVDLSKALRAVDEVERTYKPKEVKP